MCRPTLCATRAVPALLALLASACACSARGEADLIATCDGFADYEWNAQQGHMLTGGGVANREGAYAAFGADELPHAALQRGEWLGAAWGDGAVVEGGDERSVGAASGAWARSMFAGGALADFSTRVFDVQTARGAFVDVRVPPTRPDAELRALKSLENATELQLRVLSRQHAFAGVTRMDLVAGGETATRLHVADWNPPPRRTPNRFVVEPRPDGKAWTEVCAARDDRGYTAYIERWEALPGGANGEAAGFLAMHRAAAAGAAPGGGSEALLVVAGDHFARAVAREVPLPRFGDAASTPSLASLVDEAFERGDAARMRQLVSMEAAYGRVAANVAEGRGAWEVALCTHPWREGGPVWGHGATATLGTERATQRRMVRVQGGGATSDGDWVVLEDSLGEGGLERLVALIGAIKGKAAERPDEL